MQRPIGDSSALVRCRASENLAKPDIPDTTPTGKLSRHFFASTLDNVLPPSIRASTGTQRAMHTPIDGDKAMLTLCQKPGEDFSSLLR